MDKRGLSIPLVGGLLSLATPLWAACPAPFEGTTGDGTFYAADGTGACSYPATTDTLIAALNGGRWDGSAHCGECLEVTGAAGTAIVRVVDQCPDCVNAGDLDLHPSAFEQIVGPQIIGRAPIVWQRVECPVTTALSLRVKEGSNPWWIGLIPDRHRHGVQGISVLVGGQFQPMVRENYNAFTFSYSVGAGLPLPLTLRLTSTAGEAFNEVLTDLNANTERIGTHQFTACSDGLFFDYFEPR